MSAVLLTLNTTVPAPDRPGSPFLYFCDNGDWDIAFGGDLPYVEEYTDAYVGAISVVELLSMLSLEHCADEMDISGDEAHLFLEVTIDEGELEEPVAALYEDGEVDIYERIHAEKMIAQQTHGVFNFIRFPEILDELRRFLVINRSNMFDRSEEEPMDFGDDEDER